MMDEAQRVVEILQKAMKMEDDGREFYLRVADRSRNQLAASLFRTLAEEEIVHQRAVQSIYEELKAGHEWPEREILPVHAGRSENVFSTALKDRGKLTEPEADDLEAVKVALEMEERSFRLYRDRSEEADSPGEIRFYQALAAEERGHMASLRDTEEYLTDPEGWFMARQHITLDGAS